MSRPNLAALVILVIVMSTSVVFAATVPPPAVHLPDGGTIVTDVNISNTNMLGVIKQTLSSMGSILRSGNGDQRFSETDLVSANICGISNTEVVDAIRDIKSVRVLVSNYNTNAKSSKLMPLFEKGLAKIGKFSRMNIGRELPDTALIFAQENNAGYIAAMYEENTGTFVAVRLVGSLDIPKIMGWINQAAGGSSKPLPVVPNAEPMP
jgi:hypothetical protein